jgi:hypothetical protein
MSLIAVDPLDQLCHFLPPGPVIVGPWESLGHSYMSLRYLYFPRQLPQLIILYLNYCKAACVWTCWFMKTTMYIMTFVNQDYSCTWHALVHDIPKQSCTACALMSDVDAGAMMMLLSPSSWMKTWHCRNIIHSHRNRCWGGIWWYPTLSSSLTCDVENLLLAVNRITSSTARTFTDTEPTLDEGCVYSQFLQVCPDVLAELIITLQCQ